jgi:hypothetical protein
VQILYELTANQALILCAGGGFIWVAYGVFMDQGAGERDRDENGFDLFAIFRDLF